MVELIEVEDESFESKQAGPLGEENDDDYYTDTGEFTTIFSSTQFLVNEANKCT
jgi:hypothetical protein